MSQYAVLALTMLQACSLSDEQTHAHASWLLGKAFERGSYEIECYKRKSSRERSRAHRRWPPVDNEMVHRTCSLVGRDMGLRRSVGLDAAMALGDDSRPAGLCRLCHSAIRPARK